MNSRRFISILAGVTLFLIGVVVVQNLGKLNLWLIQLYYTGTAPGINEMITGLQDLLTLMLGLLIEATPFLIFGVVISAVVKYVIPPVVWDKLLARNVVIRRIILSFSGTLLPVCECGNVPIARSLVGRGLSAGDALTFLLAAPILNPVVLFVTWQAFSYEPGIFYGRFLAALIIANLTAVIVARVLRNRRIFNDKFIDLCKKWHTDKRTIGGVSDYLRHELLPLLRLLFIGALVAGLIQVFVPREVITSIGTDPVMGIVAMIILGFVISICSSVDAFFALAFASAFSPGAIAAFLVSGPMVDLKMLFLLRSTMTVRALVVMTSTVVVLAFIAGFIIDKVVL